MKNTRCPSCGSLHEPTPVSHEGVRAIPGRAEVASIAVLGRVDPAFVVGFMSSAIDALAETLRGVCDLCIVKAAVAKEVA